MGRLKRRCLAAAALLTLSVGMGAAQTPIKGRSADLGFTFEAVGGRSWCSETVQIVLEAPSATAYDSDERKLEQSLGRLRAAITAPRECPRARTIRIDARVNGSTVYTAEMSELTRWITVWDNREANGFICFDKDDLDACTPHGNAFRLIRDLARSGSLPTVQLMSFLLANRQTHAEWRSTGIVGQVRVFDLNALGADATAPLVAEALTLNAEDDCSRNAGQWVPGVVDGSTDRLTRRGFTCRRGSTAAAEEIIAWQQDNEVYVFSLRQSGREARPVVQFAERLMAGLAVR